MFVLCAILFLIIGFIMLRYPEFIYEITESWKSYSYGDPSDLYVLSTRVGGAVFIILGIACIVVAFVS